MNKTIAIACDHAGFALKEVLKCEIEALGFVCLDLGVHEEKAVDYPDMGMLAAKKVATGEVEKAVIICGSGIGISIAANRHPAIRAALCHDAYTAEMARKHNDANILALGARVVSEATAKDCLKAFLSTSFEAGRHAERVRKLGILPEKN